MTSNIDLSRAEAVVSASDWLYYDRKERAHTVAAVLRELRLLNDEERDEVVASCAQPGEEGRDFARSFIGACNTTGKPTHACTEPSENGGSVHTSVHTPSPERVPACTDPTENIASVHAGTRQVCTEPSEMWPSVHTKSPSEASPRVPACTALYTSPSTGPEALCTKAYTPKEEYKGPPGPDADLEEAVAGAEATWSEPELGEGSNAAPVPGATEQYKGPLGPEKEAVQRALVRRAALPRFSEITRIEVQVHHNAPGTNRPLYVAACFAQTDPLHLLWRKVGVRAFANMTQPRVLRRSMKLRVERGTMTENFRRDMDAASHLIEGDSVLGLFARADRDAYHSERQAAFLDLGDVDAPTCRLMIHGEIIEVSLRRTGNTNPKAARYIGYYDPLDYAAYRRLHEQQGAAAPKPEIDEIATLRQELAALRAEMAVQRT